MPDGARRMEIAQRNAAKPVSEGGLGLGPNNTAAERAKAMGFDLEVFHGTNAGDFTHFDPAKVTDNVQYGGNAYTSVDPAYASKYTENTLRGEAPTVMPLTMRSGKRFDMQQPVSAEDAAAILREMGQTERAAKIAESGRPYRSGSELFYFGLDPAMSNAQKGAYINRAGFDSIHGDPALEIIGKPGRPQSTVFDVSRLRSRFAAFDPARRSESDLLGGADPYLLGLLGLGSGGLLYAGQK